MLRAISSLECDLEALPRKVHAAGPCAWEPKVDDGAVAANASAWQTLQRQFAERDAPVLYVHHGRAFDGPSFWHHLVDGLSSVAIQVVASVARMGRDSWSSACQFRGRRSHPAGSSTAAGPAVVASGHTTVVIGAARYGLPSVLIPYGVDTPENAARVEAAGVALCLPMGGIAGKVIREAVEHVLADKAMPRAVERYKPKSRRWTHSTTP